MNKQAPKTEEKLKRTPSNTVVAPSSRNPMARLRQLDAFADARLTMNSGSQLHMLRTLKITALEPGDITDSSCASTPILDNRSTLLPAPETHGLAATLNGRLLMANYLQMAARTPPEASRLISLKHTLLRHNIQHAKGMLVHLGNNDGRILPEQKRVTFSDKQAKQIPDEQLGEFAPKKP